MSTTWPEVPLGKVLQRVARFEERDELTEYQFAGTFSFARGIFVGERKLGSTFKLPKVQRIHKGDFIYCKIMTWEGAFGIVPEEAHNCVMSGAFVAYDIDRKQIDPNYLDYYFKIERVWKSIGHQSAGTNVRRRSLHPKQFEAARIPLPPFDEQRRIVARIEELAALIEEARELRVKAREEINALCRAIIFDPRVNTVPTPMSELVTLKKQDIQVQPDEMYDFAGVYSFGRGVFRGQTKAGMDFSYRRLTTLSTGNFVYPKLMAWEGAFGIVPPECDGLVVSPEFPVFEVNEDRVLPETLDVYYRTPAVWDLIAAISTGTNVRRRRLHPSAFLRFEFPLPPLSVQMKLQEVNDSLNPVRRLQASTTDELDALLPSVLEQAFRGEL
jgi:type I restriction enzyme S subunit